MDFALSQEQRMVYEYGDRVSQRFDHAYWKKYAEKSEPPAELYKQIGQQKVQIDFLSRALGK